MGDKGLELLDFLHHFLIVFLSHGIMGRAFEPSSAFVVGFDDFLLVAIVFLIPKEELV